MPFCGKVSVRGKTAEWRRLPTSIFRENSEPHARRLCPLKIVTNRPHTTSREGPARTTPRPPPPPVHQPSSSRPRPRYSRDPIANHCPRAWQMLGLPRPTASSDPRRRPFMFHPSPEPPPDQSRRTEISPRICPRRGQSGSPIAIRPRFEVLLPPRQPGHDPCSLSWADSPDGCSAWSPTLSEHFGVYSPGRSPSRPCDRCYPIRPPPQSHGR
jgi:hypothetical protein